MMSSTTSIWIPDKKQLQKQYNEYYAHFVVLLKRLEDHLRSIVKVSALPAYKTRVKSFNSYYKKLLKFVENRKIKFDKKEKI